MTTTTTADHLRRALDGRWHQVREQARQELTAEHFGYPRESLDIESYRARVGEQLARLAALPHAGLGFSAEQGFGGDYGASVTAFEMLGHADLSLFVKAGVQFGLFGGAVANLGTQRHHAAYLQDIVAGRLLGCFAMTETGHGSDVQSLLTTATYDPDTDEIVVHSPGPQARKDYIGNAARDGRMAAVFAQLVVEGESRGVHCVLVPIRDESGTPMPGVTIGDCGAKAGLPGVDNGRLMFDQVRVPRTNLLNRYGDIDEQGRYTSPIESQSKRFFTMLGTLVRGRVSVGGGAAAATRSALALATTYALHRRQFSSPGTDSEVLLLDYRAHQRKLLPAMATSFAYLAAQNQLVESMHEVQMAADHPGRPGREDDDTERAQRELEARAAGLKALQTAHATATIQVCRESCGGAGYLSMNRLPQLKADTDVFTTFEGDNTVLLQLVAKGLLTDYKDEFSDMDTLKMVRFGARQAAGSLAERAAPGSLLTRLVTGAPAMDSPEALRDRGAQLALLEDRAQHMLEGLANRLRRAPKDDPAKAFAIFNDAQDHLIDTARAHVERLVFEAFTEVVAGCEDADARELLDLMCDLYAVSLLERDRGWYLEHGRISPAQSKRIVATMGELLEQVRPHAETLVAAFGIPEDWLRTELLESLRPERTA